MEPFTVAKSVVSGAKTAYQGVKKGSQITGIGEDVFTSKKDKFFQECHSASYGEINKIKILLETAFLSKRQEKWNESKKEFDKAKDLSANLLTTTDVARFINAAGYYWVATNMIHHLEQSSLSDYKIKWKIDLKSIFLLDSCLRPTAAKALKTKKYKKELYGLVKDMKDTVICETTNAGEEQGISSYLINLADSDKKISAKWREFVEQIWPKTEQENNNDTLPEANSSNSHEEKPMSTTGASAYAPQIPSTRNLNTKPIAYTKPETQKDQIQMPTSATEHSGIGNEASMRVDQDRIDGRKEPEDGSKSERAAAIFRDPELTQHMAIVVNPTSQALPLLSWCLPKGEPAKIINTELSGREGRAAAVRQLNECLFAHLRDLEEDDVIVKLNKIIDSFHQFCDEKSKLRRLLREARERQGV